MSSASGRRLTALVAAALLLLAVPASASATITGGCTGEGHSTSSGANLTTDTEWHLKSSDVAGGSGTAPAKMKAASVSAYALGIALPIASGTSEDGETTGSVEGVSVSNYAILGARFTVGGSATGDGSCSGEIQIILDDVNPLFTVLGGGGIILALIGLLAVLLLGRGEGGCMSRVLGAFFGGLGGVGGALAAEQFDLLDPTEPMGLFVAIGAAILGFIVPGLFSGKPDAPAPSVGGSASGGTGGGNLGARGEAPRDPSTPEPGTQTERYPGGAVGGGGPM